MEDRCVYISHHFQHVLKWWRYTDDIFLVWTGTCDELHYFHDFLNGIDPDVKFTLKWSHESLQFLDTEEVVVGERFCTKLYVEKN